MEKRQVNTRNITTINTHSNSKGFSTSKKNLNGAARNKSSKFLNSRRPRNRKPRGTTKVNRENLNNDEKQISDEHSDLNGIVIIEEKKDCENKPKTNLDIYVEQKKKEELLLLSKVMELKDYIEIPGSEVYGGTYTRVVIIGDAFLANYSKLWPLKSNIKPYFLYKNKLSVDELLKFRDHQFLKDSEKILVLFMLGLHDFTEYGTFFKASCTGNHLFTEYIKGVKKINNFSYLRKMVDTKETFETNESLSVLFSYIPSLRNVRDLRDIFNTSIENIPNCTCLCQKLGDIPGKLVETEFSEFNRTWNQRAMGKQINALREKKVFEYLTPMISFVNGNWKLARAEEKTEEDTSVLNCLLNEFVFDVDYVDILDQTKIADIKELVSSMRSRIIRNKFRVVVVGDKWIDSIASQWKSNQKICPYFYFADNLTFNDLQKVIISLIKNNEIGLVITAIPTGELFSINNSTTCKGHKSLAYPVPKERICINPESYAYELIDKMNEFLQEIKNLRRFCGVVFTTCYPVQLSAYYEHLKEVHSGSVGESMHSDSNSPIDIDISKFDAQISECTDIINKYIQTSSEVQQLPLCNIAEIVKSSSEIFAFPTYIENKFPPKSLEKELFVSVKKYIVSLYDMCASKKFSFTQTEDSVKRKNKRKYFEELKKSILLEATSNQNKRERMDVSISAVGGGPKRAKLNIPSSKAEMNLHIQKSNKSLQPQRGSTMPHLSQSFTSNGPLRSFIEEAPRLPGPSLENLPPVNYIRSLASMDDGPISRLHMRDPELTRVPIRNSDAIPYGGNQRILPPGFQHRSPPNENFFDPSLRSVREPPVMPHGYDSDNHLMRMAREAPMNQRTNNFNNIRVLGGERPMVPHPNPDNVMRMPREPPMILGGNRNW